MYLLKLPYPGYSWSLTQHMGPASEPRILFELLKAAYAFSSFSNYRELITNHIIDRGFLTPNIRNDQGKPQLWRDYQQILPELGLIFSTKFTPKVILTAIGMSWLDGEIGYSEMITTQALAFQYPNGHKQDISPIVKKILSENGRKIPTSRTELDLVSGVAIKPGVLILRILLELSKSKDLNNGLTEQECLNCLLPIQKNTLWPLAIENLNQFRSNVQSQADIRSKRHIQEWFRLLMLSDLFQIRKRGKFSEIVLTPTALSNLEAIEKLCEYHEAPGSFWIPTSSKNSELAFSWFEHFGNPNILAQWFNPVFNVDSDYFDINYPDGIGHEETTSLSLTSWGIEPTINLSPLSTLSDLGVFVKEGIVDEENILAGRLKQKKQNRLHNEIVHELSTRLADLEYDVWEDPKSVDLLARKGSEELIFEVKTINRRNISNRIRLGVGQLLEYRFRRNLMTSSNPKGILVLSNPLFFSDWQIQYFNDELNLGLLYRKSHLDFSAYTSGNFEQLISPRSMRE